MSLFALSVSIISAKSENSQWRGGKNIDIETSGSGQVVRNRITTLESVEAKIKNPQAKIAIENAIQEAEQFEATAESSLKEMSGRPGFLKFLIGPSYKNAGEVRSAIVRLRNQISKLTRTREGLSASDQDGIDQTIGALEADLTSIETKLSEALGGVSLFGWLSRLLSGFTMPTSSLTPTASPVVSPTVSASPSASIMPSPTATPVE